MSVFLSFRLEDLKGTRVCALPGGGSRALWGSGGDERTPVNPPSLTGRRPDASATSLLRLVGVGWVGGERGGSFGVENTPARPRVVVVERAR